MARKTKRTWSADEVVAALQAAADQQIATIYMRRNPQATAWGVRFADLYKLIKGIEPDATLAAELWTMPAFEPRYVALRTLPPDAFTEAQTDAWVLDLDFSLLSDEFAKVVYHTEWARNRMERWIEDDQDYVQRTGWSLLYGYAADPAESLSLDEWRGWLDRIEQSIHDAPNWSREAMNNLPIAIGLRDPELFAPAIAAAERYGKVSVFHGDKTNCKVNNAVELLTNPRTKLVRY